MSQHLSILLCAVVASTASFGCTASNAPVPDAAVSDATVVDAHSTDMSTHDAHLLDASDADAGDMSTADDAEVPDAMMADAGACVDPPSGVPVPTDLPARQLVTFHVTGSGYLALARGVAPCNPFSIFAGSTEVDQVGGLQVLCEGAVPPSPTVTRYVQLGSHDLTWDARQLISYTTAYDCDAHGWPGRGCTRERHDVHQPVDAGHYSVRVAIDDELPGSCFAVEGEPGFFECSSGGSGGPPGGGTPTTCPTARTYDVEFDLPASGNLDVDVLVPSP